MHSKFPEFESYTHMQLRKLSKACEQGGEGLKKRFHNRGTIRGLNFFTILAENPLVFYDWLR